MAYLMLGNSCSEKSHRVQSETSDLAPTHVERRLEKRKQVGRRLEYVHCQINIEACMNNTRGPNVDGVVQNFDDETKLRCHLREHKCESVFRYSLFFCFFLLLLFPSTYPGERGKPLAKFMARSVQYQYAEATLPYLICLP